MEGHGVPVKKCADTHPILKLGTGKLCGGSAFRPRVKTADIYVSLQEGARSAYVTDPWDEGPARLGVSFVIDDMEAPVNVARFKKMVTWLCNQLQHGKRIHIGCIGGHGRTGTVIAAIVAELNGEKNAIQWVRKHYCKRAVESHSQIAFLMEHYGVTKVAVTKRSFISNVLPSSPSTAGQRLLNWAGIRSETEIPPTEYVGAPRLVKQPTPTALPSGTRTFVPCASARSLWKK